MGACASRGVVVRRDPSRRGELEAWAARAGVTLPERSTFRASALAHETGVDVDLLIEDLTGQRASRAMPSLAAGGALVATTVGAGPEAFLSDERRAYPYELYAVLAKRDGAFAAGAIDIVEHDGKGNLRLAAMPFVVQAERGRVKVGTLDGPL